MSFPSTSSSLISIRPFSEKPSSLRSFQGSEEQGSICKKHLEQELAALFAELTQLQKQHEADTKHSYAQITKEEAFIQDFEQLIQKKYTRIESARNEIRNQQFLLKEIERDHEEASSKLKRAAAVLSHEEVDLHRAEQAHSVIQILTEKQKMIAGGKRDIASSIQSYQARIAKWEKAVQNLKEQQKLHSKIIKAHENKILKDPRATKLAELAEKIQSLQKGIQSLQQATESSSKKRSRKVIIDDDTSDEESVASSARPNKAAKTK